MGEIITEAKLKTQSRGDGTHSSHEALVSGGQLFICSNGEVVDADKLDASFHHPVCAAFCQGCVACLEGCLVHQLSAAQHSAVHESSCRVDSTATLDVCMVKEKLGHRTAESDCCDVKQLTERP